MPVRTAWTYARRGMLLLVNLPFLEQRQALIGDCKGGGKPFVRRAGAALLEARRYEAICFSSLAFPASSP